MFAVVEANSDTNKSNIIIFVLAYVWTIIEGGNISTVMFSDY